MSDLVTDTRSDCTLGGRPLTVEQEQLLVEAMLAARSKYPGYEVLEPVMLYIAQAIVPNWSRITVAEFWECLYVIAKTSDFAAGAREQVLFEEASVPMRRM